MLRILICPEEFHNDTETNAKLQAWRNSGLQLVLLKNGFEEELLSGLQAPEDTLWIVTTEEQWRIGVQNHIATLPYSPEDTYAFPKAEYIMTGLEDIEKNFLKQVYCRFHNLPWTIAKTADFVLREFAMEDLDALFLLYEDESLYPYVEHLFPREDEAIYEEKYIKNMYQLLGFGMWLVCDPLSGEVIGRAGLEAKEAGEDVRLEMGYLIRKDYRGKGLATKVCKEIIRYAREELSYPSISCLIHDDNEASIRLVKKLGFAYADQAEDGMSRYELKITR